MDGWMDGRMDGWMECNVYICTEKVTVKTDP